MQEACRGLPVKLKFMRSMLAFTLDGSWWMDRDAEDWLVGLVMPKKFLNRGAAASEVIHNKK